MTKENRRNNKSEISLLKAHERATTTTLKECYGKWSWEKEYAFNKCKSKCQELGGYDFKIISHNVNMFSIGFYYIGQDNKVMFHYETNNLQATRKDIELKGETLNEFTYDIEQGLSQLSDSAKKHIANVVDEKGNYLLQDKSFMKSAITLGLAFDLMANGKSW